MNKQSRMELEDGQKKQKTRTELEDSDSEVIMVGIMVGNSGR